MGPSWGYGRNTEYLSSKHTLWIGHAVDPLQNIDRCAEFQGNVVEGFA